MARAGRRLNWKGNRESVLDDALGFSNGFTVPFLVPLERQAFAAPPASGDNGWLGVYERTVGRLSDGATLRR
jgi:hypothetical protein